MRRGSGLGLCGRLWLAAFPLLALVTLALLAQKFLLLTRLALVALTFVPPLALEFLLLTRALLGRAHKFPSMQFA